MTTTGVDRQQTNNFESATNTRQDRNTYITDGGQFSWDAGGEALTWSDTIRIRIGGFGEHTIAAGTLLGLADAGSAAVLVLDRTTPSALSLIAADIDSSNNENDETLVIGVRGEDDRFYLMDGTAINDGATVSLGNPVTDTERVYLTSDGRTNPDVYGLGDVVFSASVGDTTTPFEFVATPHDFVADGVQVGDYVVLKVLGEAARVIGVSVGTLDLASALTSGTGLEFDVITDPVEFVIGSEQAEIQVGGITMEEGVHYVEVGTPGDVGVLIRFASGDEPLSGETITGVNLSGSRGPQGPVGGDTLQASYDGGGVGAGREIEITSGNEVDFHEDADTGTVVLQTWGTDSTRNNAEVQSDGRVTAKILRIPDGSGDYWRFIGTGPNLEIKHTSTGEIINFASDGRIGFGGADFAKWADYTGSLADVGVTTIATGITGGILGVALLLEDTVTGLYIAAEMFHGSVGSKTALVRYDSTSGDIILSSDVAGPPVVEVGADLHGGAGPSGTFALLVFY